MLSNVSIVHVKTVLSPRGPGPPVIKGITLAQDLVLSFLKTFLKIIASFQAGLERDDHNF